MGGSIAHNQRESIVQPFVTNSASLVYHAFPVAVYAFDQRAVAYAAPSPSHADEMWAMLHCLRASETKKHDKGVMGNLREILTGQCTYCQHCLPCPEGIEIGWVIWDLDQIPARGIEQVKEWYAGFPVKASACVECGACVERCPFEVDILAKMREAATLFEGESA